MTATSTGRNPDPAAGSAVRPSDGPHADTGSAARSSGRPRADAGAWSAEVVRALRAGGLDPAAVAAVIDRALAEDFADGPDVTTLTTVPGQLTVHGRFASRESGVLAGAPVAVAVLESVAGGPVPVRSRPDGDRLEPGTVALDVTCGARELLSAERTALNLLGHLSGIATVTRRWVDAVAGTGTRIRDTRKTLPGLRALQKYAVRCGGGVNHRMSLGDAALIKDNHVASAGSVAAAVRALRAVDPDIPLEVEVDSLEQFDEAVAAGAELVLLDNFPLPDVVEAVRRRDTLPRRVALEASGGLTLERARAVAATGVDYLAVGALTHSVPVLDLGLDLLE